MKPIIHIIGLGWKDLDSLSLASYKVFKRTEYIWVWSLDHPATLSMRREGFTYEGIFPENDEHNKEEDLEIILDTAAEKIRSITDLQDLVLAMQGFPILEGKIVSGLVKRLEEFFAFDTQLLASAGSLEKLTAIMAELRSDWGCPWDKEQNHESLKRYLIEETYEVIEAIDSKNMNNFCEELGDLLLQIVFHSQIASESKCFNIDDIMQGISEKLIRRHPHIFGTVQAKSSQEVLVNWDAIKQAEKAGVLRSAENDKESFFDIPRGFPALMLAEKTQKKAAKVGFDWDGYQGPLEKIYEELTELKAELNNMGNNNPRLTEELGDVLFSIVNLSRFLEIDAEEALRLGTVKFQKRFNKIIAKISSEGTAKRKYDLDIMNFYWEQVKNEEKSGV